MAVAADDTKKDLVSRQKKWLKANDSSCARKGAEHGGVHPWPIAIETLCLAGNLEKRSLEFSALYECIHAGKKTCGPLKSRP